jgi:HSP20 family protein
MLKKGPLSVVKTKPESALSSFEEVERRLDEFWRRPFAMLEAPWWPRWGAPSGEFSPTVDVYEEGRDIVVKAEIPGMRKEDIHVDIDERSLTIYGEKQKEEKVERKDYVRLERSHGSFARTLDLRAAVQTDKARAVFKDGVLEVRVPKTEEAVRRTRKIAVD